MFATSMGGTVQYKSALLVALVTTPFSPIKSIKQRNGPQLRSHEQADNLFAGKAMANVDYPIEGLSRMK